MIEYHRMDDCSFVSASNSSKLWKVPFEIKISIIVLYAQFETILLILHYLIAISLIFLTN